MTNKFIEIRNKISPFGKDKYEMALINLNRISSIFSNHDPYAIDGPYFIIIDGIYFRPDKESYDIVYKLIYDT